jgi:KDO2-lipid IV(A) lauroyltransferase
VEDALNTKKGIVFVTAHLGSYETAFQVLAFRSVKTTALVESIKPPALLAHVNELRQRFGVSCLPSKPGTIGSLYKRLLRGEAVFIVSDRDIDGNGIRTTFFGKDTSLPTVAVRLAMKTGAALIPIFGRRSNGRFEVEFEPAIELHSKRGSDSLVDNVEKVAKIMEKHIGRSPEQWVVLYPLWTKQDFIAS